MCLTMLLFSARKTFSIFIASTIASTWPNSILSPAETEMERITPGMGHKRRFDVSLTFFSGISFASSAIRVLRTTAKTSIPRRRNLKPLPDGNTFITTSRRAKRKWPSCCPGVQSLVMTSATPLPTAIEYPAAYFCTDAKRFAPLTDTIHSSPNLR